MLPHFLRVVARQALLACLLLVAACGREPAGPDYPALTGRVVDQAQIVSPAAEATLDRQLAAHEGTTGQQVVVVTVESLQGASIEEYGVGLGRHWGIGSEGEDDGVLLVVAPNEREVRIEVGYGLEGTLTDALTSQIVRNEILPRFRAGDLEAGIVAGAGAILSALGGGYEPSAWSEREARPAPGAGQPPIPDWAIPILFFGAWAVIVLFMRRRGRRGRGLWMGAPGIGGGFGRRGLGRGGGGFSGGGGSFGGGGASGRW